MLEEGKRYALDFETSHGPITAVLDPDLGGPIPNSIAFLATKGFYDGLSFHRVVPGFVLQGGCPNGTGTGDPGYEVVGTPPRFYEYKVGDFAMAKTAVAPPGASGSQFFVISGRAARACRAEYGILGHARDDESLATIARIDALGRGDGPPSEPVRSSRSRCASSSRPARLAAAERLLHSGKRLEESVMEGGFPFGMFGDPGDMQKHLQEMAEHMQVARVGWADTPSTSRCR